MPFYKTKKNRFVDLSAVVGVLLFFALWGRGASAREMQDSTGTKVNLVDAPQRIVALAPSLGELAADFLKQDLNRLAGVSEFTDYPPALKKLPSVGPYNHFSIEKILSLKPDLILATQDGNSKEQVLHLREMNLPVVTVDTGSFEEIGRSIRLVSQAIGVPREGDRMVEQLNTGLDRIKKRAESRPHLKVMLQLGDDIVAGRKSFLNDALLTVGATNVYGDSNFHYPKVALEDVLHRDPDAIVVIVFGDEMRTFEDMRTRWNRYPQLKAVKNKRIYLLRSDALIRPTLRILEGIALLERTLYGKD